MPNTTVAGVLKHLGLIGPNAMPSNSLVPKSNTPQAIQQMMTDFNEAGKIENPDIWARYSGALQGPRTYDQMLKLWDEMSGWDLMAAALVEFVDEATATDSNSPGVIWYECNDSEFEDDLNDLLLNLDVESMITNQVWHVAGLGNHFEKLDYEQGQGVTGMTMVHPFEVRRYWLQRNRDCIGFKWMGHEPPNKEDALVGLDNTTPIERIQLSDSQNIESLWYPWDFLHFRRMFRYRGSEHGEPIFDEAQGIYKKLRIAIDQMVVHRAQIQPDRYAIKVDVQEQPPTEQIKTLQRWKQSLRSKLSFGPGNNVNLSDPNDFKSFYNPLALDTILWVAQPKGFQHAIDKLGGTSTIPDVFDIELLTDLFYSIIGMPKSWFGMSKDGQPAPSGKALLAQDIRFLRKVKSIRRPILGGYTWLAYFHAVLKGKDVSQLDIKAKMSEIGGLEEQMKIELLEKQAMVLAQLGDVMQAYNLPKEAWVEIIFKRYMHLPDDVVNVFITSLPNEIQPAQEGKSKSVPPLRKILAEIDSRVGPEAASIRMLAEALHSGVKGGRRVNEVKYRKLTDVIKVPNFKLQDYITSSDENSGYQVNTLNTKSSLQDSRGAGKKIIEVIAKKTDEKILESKKDEPGWRAYMNPKG